MKKTVKVVKEVGYEIDIDDSILNQNFVYEFEESFWELEGDNLDDKFDSLFKVAAGQLANGEESFIEGIGRCASVRTVNLWRKDGVKIDVVWKDIYEDIEMEIVE